MVETTDNVIAWEEKLGLGFSIFRDNCEGLFHLGPACAIDESMIRFRGRSAETTLMKNKPISCGYKLWVLADSETGFAHTFIPTAPGKGPVHMQSSSSDVTFRR